MAWWPGWFRKGKGWRGGPGYGYWPGKGPWSYLPPWERPGWYYGRGWCWWYGFEDKHWLETYRDYLKRELAYVEERLKNLSSSQASSDSSS